MGIFRASVAIIPVISLMGSHVGQIDEIDHDLDHLGQIDQIDRDLDNLDPNLPL